MRTTFLLKSIHIVYRDIKPNQYVDTKIQIQSHTYNNFIVLHSHPTRISNNHNLGQWAMGNGHWVKNEATCLAHVIISNRRKKTEIITGNPSSENNGRSNLDASSRSVRSNLNPHTAEFRRTNEQTPIPTISTPCPYMRAKTTQA